MSDVRDFLTRDIYQADLSTYRPFLSVSQTTIGNLPPKDLALLVEWIVHFKQDTSFKKDTGFNVQEAQIVELEGFTGDCKSRWTLRFGETSAR